MPKKLTPTILLTSIILLSLFSSCSIISNFTSVATVESMEYEYPVLSLNPDANTGVVVNLKPTSKAQPNTMYIVDLYESGRLRASKSTFWTTDELQTYGMKSMLFVLPLNELLAYINAGKPTDSVFSVKIRTAYTPNPTVNPKSTSTAISTVSNTLPQQLTVTYPSGGEIWHVGQTVTITWSTVNIPSDWNIDIQTVNANNGSPLSQVIGVTTNTGSYQWVVTNKQLGTHEKVSIVAVLDQQRVMNFSTNEFTISP